MSKCLFYTQAWNAEKTLASCMESVLAQTHGDWEWIVIDNGSRDGTSSIIHEYARRDKRIIPRANREYDVFEQENIFIYMALKNRADYYSFLDADDEYKPDFLGKMLAFITENRLDVAVCGSDFIDAQTRGRLGTRVLSKDIFLEGEKFSDCLADYFPFARTLWGKLFSNPVLLRYNHIIPTVSVPYGWDTLFSLECFRNSSRVGILAESLHNYYVSQKSGSYRWAPGRIDADRLLLKAARDFLIDKCGSVSPRNEEFLLLVYLAAIRDTLIVLLNAELPEPEKISGVLDVFSHEYTRELAELKISRGNAAANAQRRELFALMANMLLGRKDVPDEQLGRLCDVGKLLCEVCGDRAALAQFEARRTRLQ